jgi:hypothetical protein
MLKKFNWEINVQIIIGFDLHMYFLQQVFCKYVIPFSKHFAHEAHACIEIDIGPS